MRATGATRRLPLWVGALASAGLLVWGTVGRAPSSLVPQAQTGHSQTDATGTSSAPSRADVQTWLFPDVHRSVRSAAQIEAALFRDGSLRGSSLDGGFRLDEQGRLMPSREVRRRFDQLLSTLGEASIEELTLLLRQQALAELQGNAEAADQVMAVWDRYVSLQRHRFQVALDPREPDSLRAGLAERQQVRRQWLGLEWADAFFSDDESALLTQLQTLDAGSATAAGDGSDTADASLQQAPHLPDIARAPGPGDDAADWQRQRVAMFGAEAAARLQALDEEEARWNTRIAQAQTQVAALQSSAELSGLQKAQAVASYIDAHFSAGSERLRARALLGVSSMPP